VATSTMLSLMLALMRSDGRSSKKNEENNPSKILTVEQAGNKNIRELKGMPNAQLIPSMRFMSASLGVRCEFCHLSKDGELDAASDEKKEKETARDMIKMVRAINRANFRGEPQVSCFTCHAGQPVPQKFPSLPVQIASAAASTQPAETLPPVSAVIEKYIAAIGGRAAIEKITSCVMRGKLATASGLTGTYETEQVPPHEGYESVNTSLGERERAVNETAGWEKTSFGITDLSRQQLSDTRLSLPLLLDVGLNREYLEAEVSRKEKIDNRETYVVDATRKDDKRERLYFDSETGLLLRRISYAPTMIGIIPEQIDLGDYREVEGVKFPFTVRVSTADSNNPSTIRTFDEINVNVPVANSKFEKPKS
jgi:Photosynthetic reaction centre cytochrome C subunit